MQRGEKRRAVFAGLSDLPAEKIGGHFVHGQIDAAINRAVMSFPKVWTRYAENVRSSRATATAAESSGSLLERGTHVYSTAAI